MSKRIDITNNIFNDIYVLEFEKKQNTHALYKCLCMLCNKLTYITYSNLVSGNTKSCQSCGQKATNYKQDYEILERLNNFDKVTHIADDYNINRSVVNRIKSDNLKDQHEWKTNT